MQNYYRLMLLWVVAILIVSSISTNAYCETAAVSLDQPGPERIVCRSAGSITLPRGKYRIEVSLLEPVTALKGIPAYFGLGSSFKISPNREDCR